MKRILYILTVLTFMSCKDKAQQIPQKSSEGRASFSQVLEVKTNRRVELLPEAKEQVSQWLAYATAQNEIESLRTSTGYDLLETSNSLLQIMESLQTSIPDTLQTPAVNARANVLFTKASILNQLSNKKEKDATEIFEVANDLIEEFDNFKLQLNELFLKSPGDFETEMDEEFEEAKSRDTLRDRP